MPSTDNPRHNLYIKPGDHLVILYEEEEEATDYLVTFIHAALKKNERCLYIANAENADAVLSKILLLKTEGFLQGDLVVLSQEESYAINGEFNPDRMITLLMDQCDQALADGYTGLSVTGDISPVLAYDRGRDLIIEYELKLNDRLFNAYPVTGLCRYNIHKFSYEMISDVIRLHPLIIWKNTLHENPFYLPPEGFNPLDGSRHQVATWLRNIQDFTREKSRFRNSMEQKDREVKALHDNMTDSILKALSGLLTVHDPYTTDHSENVALLAREFAVFLELPEETVGHIYYAGLVHDIGKTLVPKRILNKSGPLTAEEFDLMKKHPLHGAASLENIQGLEGIALGVKHHHERWDGRGYPDGLEGEAIPFISRILALADTFDAMTNDRTYRRAFSRLAAIKEILACAGSQFEASLAASFVSYLEQEDLLVLENIN